MVSVIMSDKNTEAISSCSRSSYDGIAMRPWEHQNKKIKNKKPKNNKNIDAIEVRKNGDLVGDVYHGK